ncbi:MAG: hypothetical protein NTW19_19560 [Planctomycetota bacterium]|nr:hypothetical protein [Planctomycetota bacterium]
MNAKPRLLVSVRNAEEALAAVAGGADIIDVKEPMHGSLGAATPATLATVVQAVAGARPVSAALGELTPVSLASSSIGAKPTGPLALAALPSGLAYAKLGLASAPPDWRERLATHFAPSAAAATSVAPPRPIAAAYADAGRAASPAVADVLAWAIQHRAAGLLIDTYIKDGQGLFAWMTDAQLTGLIAQARAANLLIALAGSLADDAFARAAALRPDILAVRGAACAGRDRTAAVSAGRVAALVTALANAGR